MLDLLIKFLGGYTQEEVDKIIDSTNSLLDIEKEEFNVNDFAYMYYVSKRHYQQAKYYKVQIKKIITTHEADKTNTIYEVNVLDSDIFVCNFGLDEKYLSKTKIGLRHKIVNSNSYTFLTIEDVEK